MEISINYWMVLVAGVIGMALGALWYSPILFGRVWMRLSGFTEEQMKVMKEKGMIKSYVLNFLTILVMAFVLIHFVAFWDVKDLEGGLQLAFWTWLGFVATVMLNSVLWEGKSFKLYLINAGYQLVAMILMVMVFVFWK